MSFSVIMICTGNICRSPMAEGILRTMLPAFLKPTVHVGSAGTQGLHGNRAEPFAIEAAAFYGADIGDHRARMLDSQLVKSADLILVMENHHLDVIGDMLFFRCKYARLLGDFAMDRKIGQIEDPYGGPLSAYQACARDIVACMPGLIDHIGRQVR